MQCIPILDNLIEHNNGTTYLPIGTVNKIFKNNKLLGKIADKLAKNTKQHVEEMWATVGRADDKPVDWSGEVECSGKGNILSLGVAGREVDLIRNWQIMPKKSGIAEKFISFDKVKFGASAGSRKIRMTVMLQAGESAVAFYQHTGENDTNSIEGFTEYILPTKTTEADRRTFEFDVPEEDEAAVKKNGLFGLRKRFLVKVLTFKSNGGTSLRSLYTMGEQYRLLKFDANANDFREVGGGYEIDPAKKTLLLIHGTFSSTAKSYKGLYGADDKRWLQQLLQNGRKYEQVIAFDHYTVVDGPRENADEFVRRLGNGFRFTKSVDMISTSRGGLVGKTICNDQNIYKNILQIEKFAPVACANGVDYFTKAAPKVVSFLNAMKVLGQITGNVSLEIIMSALQMTAEDFLAQPGMRAMTPGSDELKAIIGTPDKPVNPANPNTRYYPICGDYQRKKIDPLKNALDRLIGKILGPQNDWVVGTKNQVIMPTGYYALGLNAEYFLAHSINCRHLDYLKRDKLASDSTHPQELIWDYLHDH